MCKVYQKRHIPCKIIVLRKRCILLTTRTLSNIQYITLPLFDKIRFNKVHLAATLTSEGARQIGIDFMKATAIHGGLNSHRVFEAILRGGDLQSA